MIAASRRTFIAGLLAAVAAPAVAMPRLVEATQSMVEDAIADSAFHLNSICWTARFDIFAHRFDVFGRTQQRALELALAGMQESNRYRVMPAEMAEGLTARYGAIWQERDDLDRIDLSMTPEQLGLIMPASLVEQVDQGMIQGRRYHIPNLSAARRLQEQMNGGPMPPPKPSMERDEAERAQQEVDRAHAEMMGRAPWLQARSGHENWPTHDIPERNRGATRGAAR